MTKNKTTHTPGPKEYEKGPRWFAWEARLIDGPSMEWGVGEKGKIPFAEGLDEEHARLIAAAPDLIESARYVDSCLPSARDLSDYGDDEPIELCMTVKAIKDMRAAIAKAEGR